MAARRWSSAVFLGVLLGVVPPAPAPASPAEDAAVVYCLDRRAALVRAAVALGKGSPGSAPELIRADGTELTVDRWRAVRAGDFRASCAALRAANAPAAGPSTPNHLTTAGTTLLSATVGAVLTWLLTSSRERAARRRQEALELRVAARAYTSAVLIYLLGWTGRPGDPPSGDTVVERLVDVEARLRKLRLDRPDWDEPRAALETLGAAPLGPELLDQERWSAQSRAQRDRDAEKVTRHLAKLTDHAEHVAYRLEHKRRRAHATAETG